MYFSYIIHEKLKGMDNLNRKLNNLDAKLFLYLKDKIKQYML